MKSAGARQARRRWRRDCLASFAGYSVLVLASPAVVDGGWPLAVRGVAALAPMLPIAYFIWALVVFSRSWDEMQRRILLEAFLIAGAGVALGSFAWGWLALRVGVPELHAIWILPVLLGALGVACWFVSRRYR